MNAGSNSIILHDSWKTHLALEFKKKYMLTLKEFLLREKAKGKIIFPKGKEYFNALNSTPFEKVKAVIIGQDPYHGPGQAHGLCFSVPPKIPQPPSLMNIFKELKNDLDVLIPEHGCLMAWALQGVLLLNSVLTVESGKAASHRGKGWECFTDKIISVLNEKRENLVFLLWGSYAQAKGSIINPKKHLILKSVHPSPLSAFRGFFGNHHFSKTNEYLEKHGISPINWEL